jgi:hypothetical protein
VTIRAFVFLTAGCVLGVVMAVERTLDGDVNGAVLAFTLGAVALALDVLVLRRAFRRAAPDFQAAVRNEVGRGRRYLRSRWRGEPSDFDRSRTGE